MVPSDAPTDFVPLKWRPYVLAPYGRIDRHYYELCTLWELRGALRAGNVWVPQSRRYANPETYLIPPPKWPALRSEVCQQLHVPADGAVRLEQRGRELMENQGLVMIAPYDNLQVITGQGTCALEILEDQPGIEPNWP